ncbi:GAD-like domain-containing protein [Xenorhabdus entomophaga]|uniref:GAD-like domain-containing protein n=1 Tax=Xenorhabdus entomophaga TaxID=3136257 RepID=UPI0030F44071
MLDLHFEDFIKTMGEATQYTVVPSEEIEKWRGKLPDRLLLYWEVEGWASYKNGLLRIANPDDYKDIVRIFMERAQFEPQDTYHVIAVSGIGTLFLYGEETGINTTIESNYNMIIHEEDEFCKKDESELDYDICSLFDDLSFYLSDNNEYTDEIFDKAIGIHGILNDNEIFCFEPAIYLGGQIKLENIRKVDINTQLKAQSQQDVPLIDKIE